MDTEVTKSTDLSGQVIGNYHITGRLGRGGMADVYKALHTELKVHRAIKFIRPEFVTSEDFRTRFQKEAQAVAKLEHPNIVRIHDFGNADNQFYMVMQFIEGLDLKNRLAAERVFDSNRAIDLVVDIAGALTYAHQRDLIHRDIKPDNIMLDESGAPILMDFGIAKLLTESTALTQTGAGIGTPAYMAPEQAKGQSITPATDIYALAIVLYELVTGSKPYSADTPIAVMLKAISDPLPLPRDINPAVSEELQAVILKGTAKDPLQRYQSAAEFAEDLRAVRQGSEPTIALTAPVTADMIRGAATSNSAQTANPTSKTAVVVNKVARGFAWLGGLTFVAALGGLYWWLNQDEKTSEPAASSALTQPETNTGTSAKEASINPAPANATASNSDSSTSSALAPQKSSVNAPAASPSKSVAFKNAASKAGEGEILAFRDTLAQGQVLEQNIELSAGDTIYMQVHKASNTTDFKLLPPGGRKTVLESYTNTGPVAIKQSGTHRVSIVPRGGKESEIDMQLFRLGEATLDGGTISFGDYQSATTKWPGQRLEYTADLAAGDTVFFEVLRSGTTSDFNLRSLDDRKDLFSSYTNSGPVKIPQAGPHKFFADPRGPNLADYEFTMHKLNPAVIKGGTYQPDSYAEGRTAQPGQIVSYTAEFNAGDYVFFEVSRSKTTTDYTLAEPGGRDNVFSSYTNSGPHKLKRSGTYTITVDPRSTNLGDYEFRLHRLAPGVISGGKATPNEVVSGATTQPGQVAHYSLTIEETANVSLEVVRTTGTTDFTLRDPDDRSNIFSSYTSVAAKELEPGTYKFVVDPRTTNVPEYEFLLRVQPIKID